MRPEQGGAAAGNTRGAWIGAGCAQRTPAQPPLPVNTRTCVPLRGYQPAPLRQKKPGRARESQPLNSLPSWSMYLQGTWE